MELNILKGKTVAELRIIASAIGVEGAAKMKKKELFELLSEMNRQAESDGAPEAESSAGVPESEPSDEAPAPSARKRRGRRRKSEINSGVLSAEIPAPSEDTADAKTASAGTAAQPASAEADTTSAPAENAAAPASADLASGEEKTAALPAPAAPERLPEPEQPASEQAPAAEPQAAQPADAQPSQPQKRDRSAESQKEGRFETTGVLDLAEGGFGFLRFDNFLTSDKDIYVSPTQIRRFNLKTGDMITGICHEPGPTERFGGLLFVKTVNGDEPVRAIRRPDFSELTPTYPDRRVVLEKGSSALSMRLTDLVAPIGLGQRGLIVAPPKAGKTTLLKQIAKSIEAQDIDAELIVLLIDERPEEVTDMQESIKGHVIYSTFDELPSHHVKVAEMVLARAMRLCEQGKNVIILMDSITRLARAYNLVEPSSGRTLSGGLDPAALYKPKRFFGAARNTREGGSVTILATALIETGSRMDDMIYEEFKGTGNMELHLDRRLQEKRIFPAIDLNKSGTRREEMLMNQDELEAVWMMRRAVADMGVEDATERIIFELVHTRTNLDFIQRIKRMRI